MTSIHPQNTSPAWHSKNGVFPLLILVVTILLYGNTITHSFTQDDAIVIHDNDFTRQGFQGLDEIFTKDSFAGFFKVEGKSNLVAGGRYRPMTLAAFAVIWQFVGNTPWIFHLFAILSYALLGITLFRLLKLLDIGNVTNQSLLACIATLIFMLHPIHTEVVANVKGLDEVWSLQWSLLATALSIQYLRFSKLTNLVGAALCLFIGLLSKENAIVWLVLIPLIALFFNRANTSKKISILTLSLLGVTILYFIIRIQVIGWSMGHVPQEMMNNPFIKQVDGNYYAFTASEKSATIVHSLGKYVQLLFFPHPLTHDYYPRHVGVMTWSDPSVIMATLMHTMMMGIAVLGIRKKSFITFCIFFFYITLGLMTNILFPIGTHLSERFLFTPSLGFALLATLAWREFSDNGQRKMINYIGIGILILFAIKTISRNRVWQDDFTLFTTDVHVSTNSAKVRNAAAGALIQRSTTLENDSQKDKYLTRALEHLSIATQIHPNYKNAHLLTGNAHVYLNQYDEAITSYDQVLALDPNDTEGFQNLLLALREGGRHAGSVLQDYPLAIRYLNRSVALSPEDAESMSLLGIAHGSNGDHREAIKYFEKAIEMKPERARNYVHLAYAQLNLGEDENAQINLQLAAEIDPSVLQ